MKQQSSRGSQGKWEVLLKPYFFPRDFYTLSSSMKALKLDAGAKQHMYD
jgi:hypothetical protein